MIKKYNCKGIDIMNYDSKKYNVLLLEKFPSLKEEFDEYTSWQDGINTGSTLIYEDVFVPYVIKQLVNDNTEELEKISSLIEDLITSNDEYAVNIAYVAILESLKSDSSGQKIEGFLKQHSKKEYNELTF